MQLTENIIAIGCGSIRPRAAYWLPSIQAACNQYAINTPLRVAAFLATIGVESGRLLYVSEIWGPTAAQQAYEPPAQKATELGNTDVGDGKLYRGRGLIQITGKSNYAICGLALNLPLIDHPELLESPDNAANSAAWFWDDNNLNALADTQNFQKITIHVNGGLTDYAQRLQLYSAAKRSLQLN